jgi:Lon protease-like protein
MTTPRLIGPIIWLMAMLFGQGPGWAQSPGPASATTLPAEIPLFPLPDVVLFPGIDRPFVIYEPRYREMVADALDGNRVIGMVLLRPGFEKDYDGRPPIYDIGTAGEITKYEKLADGRYLILLHGFTRFRVTSEDHRRPYRLAQVTPLSDVPRDQDLAPLSAARERIASLLVTALPLGAELPDPALSDVDFVNLVAQWLPMDDVRRQELLERASTLARARALIDMLELR